MIEAVICEPLRTPVGRYGGALSSLTPPELAALAIRATVDRAALAPTNIDDVLLGQCYPNGEAPAIGRVAALDAGLPVEVPGLQLDRRCGSGLQAVIDAAMRVQTGAADLVLAGGVESMSQAEHYVMGVRWGARGSVELSDRLARGRVTAGGVNHPVEGGMVETAENVRALYAVPREEQDQLAYESHQRAGRAIAEGRFKAEIVPVPVTGRRGDVSPVDRDEHVRPDTTPEKLASLVPLRREVDPDATVTAGNASGQNDAAAVCIVTSRERAWELGLRPVARLASWGLAGVPPHLMGMGPVPATKRALERASLGMADIDLIELNEAFAAQVLGVTREWDFGRADFERLNVNGSGISLGHPVGATGCRVLVTLLHEMQRREVRYGLETMCIGGGQGLAAVFERVA